jgi:fructose-1,6-bisphosphatase
MTLAYQRFTSVLLLSVFWCAVARMSKFLIKIGKSGREIRKMLVQVYGDNAMKKTAIYKEWQAFLTEEQMSLTKRDQDGQQRAELKKTLQKFVKLCVKIVGCQKHSRASVRKNGPKGAHRRTKEQGRF